MPSPMVTSSKLFQEFAYNKKRNDEFAEALQLLHMADRIYLLKEEIIPKLRNGSIVICDRYLLTSLVTMNYFGIKEDWFISLLRRRIIGPTIWIYTYASPKTTLDRLLNRKTAEKHLRAFDFNEFEESIRLELKFAKKNRMLIIDTGTKSKNECFLEIVSIIDNKIF
jgi:thymidylate kinase